MPRCGGIPESDVTTTCDEHKRRHKAPLGGWRGEYNTARSHGSLRQQTPTESAAWLEAEVPQETFTTFS
jgi:hypothetical protein